jgi:hypothetical protein
MNRHLSAGRAVVRLFRFVLFRSLWRVCASLLQGRRVIEQRYSAAPHSHFVPAWQPDAGWGSSPSYETCLYRRIPCAVFLDGIPALPGSVPRPWGSRPGCRAAVYGVPYGAVRTDVPGLTGSPIISTRWCGSVDWWTPQVVEVSMVRAGRDGATYHISPSRGAFQEFSRTTFLSRSHLAGAHR